MGTVEQIDWGQLRQRLGILTPQEVDVLQHHPYKKDPAEPDIPLVRNSYPVVAQGIVGFAFGMMLSPYSVGIEFVFSFVVVYELCVYAVTGGKPPYWRWGDRIFVVSCYFLGWIMGRALAGWRDPFKDSNFVTDWRDVTSPGPSNGMSSPEQVAWQGSGWPFPTRTVGPILR